MGGIDVINAPTPSTSTSCIPGVVHFFHVKWHKDQQGVCRCLATILSVAVASKQDEFASANAGCVDKRSLSSSTVPCLPVSHIRLDGRLSPHAHANCQIAGR